METFSLSRANFHAFALFSVCVPACVCFSYKLDGSPVRPDAALGNLVTFLPLRRGNQIVSVIDCL